jgi:hypothetical protein
MECLDPITVGAVAFNYSAAETRHEGDWRHLGQIGKGKEAEMLDREGQGDSVGDYENSG